MATIRAVLFALIMLSLASAAFAGVPGVISYQGKLMQPSGAPVPDGAYSIRFAIYDSPTANIPLWSETNSAVQITGGLFSVLLGSTNNLPANIFDVADRYFAMKVNDDPEMIPRQRIGSVAYATRAASADIAMTVSDGAITTEKLANQSVTADKLMPGSATPSGTISMFAGVTPPTGWMICDGSAVSRTTYAALYAVIGTAYGTGDGSTTFNLPNLLDKFALGMSADKTLGASGGQTALNLQHSHATHDHILTWNEMPAHSHGVNDPGHTHAGFADTNKPYQWSSGTNPFRPATVVNTDGLGAYNCFTTNSTGVSIQNAGANWGHNHGNTSNSLSSTQDIMNPYVVVNYIIKL